MALGMEVGLSAVDYGVNGDPAPLPKSFQNFVAKGFIAAPIDVLCSNFVKFGRREIGKVVHYLSDKKKENFAWLSSSLLRESRRKFAKASSPECSQSAPDFIQIGSLSAELYPNA